VVSIDRPQRQARRQVAGATSGIPIGAVIAALLLIAGVAALFFSVKSTKRPTEFYYTPTLICTNFDCQHLFKKKLSTRNVYPHLSCPLCKQQTAYRAVRCRNCGEVFPLIQQQDENPTIGLICPNCESIDIDFDSTAVPLEGEGEE